MKKIAKLFAGLTAAAALFGAIGCKNQLDYVEENTERNAFKVSGLYVEGLDEVYNGADAKLMVVEADENGDKTDVLYATAKIGYSYQSEGITVGYKSGTAYIKLTESVIYDGDKFAKSYYDAHHTDEDFSPFTASKLECYLEVGSNKIQIVNENGEFKNAKLEFPTSKANTEDADLKERFVKVSILNNIGTFSLSAKAEEPINSTLTAISLDITGATAENLASDYPYLTVNQAATNAKEGYQKFTITVVGLEDDQVGLEVEFAGALISPINKDGDLVASDVGDCWYEDGILTVAEQEASGLHQTIAKATADIEGISVRKDDIYVSCSVYGKTPGWAAAGAGPAFKVYKFGAENKDKVYFLRTGSGDNFFFPKYTVTDGKDVEVVIDVSKLTKGTDYSKADPVAPVDKVTISGIYIANAPVPENEVVYITTPDGFGSAKQKASWWDLPDNKYDNADTHSYAATDLIRGNFEWIFSEPVTVTPNAESFSLGLRLIDDDTTISSDFWKNDLTSGGICTASFLTSEYASGDYTLFYDYKSGAIYLLPFDNTPWTKIQATLQFKITGGTANSMYWINGNAFDWSNGWPFAAWNGSSDVLTASPQYVTFADASGNATFTTTATVDLLYNVAKTVNEAVDVVGVKADANNANTYVADGEKKFDVEIPALTESKTFVVDLNLTNSTCTVTEGAISTKVILAGVIATGLNAKDYPDNTKAIIGGDQLGWPSDGWAGTDKVATVTSGQFKYDLASPVDVTNETLNVLVNPSDWGKRLAELYQKETVDGSVKNTFTGNTVYLYASCKGLSTGDKINWQLVDSSVITKLLPAEN